MSYEAPQIVASFPADAIFSEAAASGGGSVTVGSFHRDNATAAIVGGSVGAVGLGALFDH